jgi:WD40 repeat protein
MFFVIFSQNNLLKFRVSFSIFCVYFLLVQLSVSAKTENIILEKIESAVENTPGLGSAIQKFGQKETEFYTASDTDVIHIFDFSGKELKKIKAGFYSISPDGKLILSRKSENSFYLFSILGNKISQIEGDGPNFSPNGKCFTTLMGDNINLYDSLGQRLTQVQGRLNSFGIDGQWLAIEQQEKYQTTLIDCASGRKSVKISGLRAKFSSDSQYLVSTLRNLDNSQINFVHNLLGQKISKFSGDFIDFSLDSKRLVASLSLGELSLFDLTGKQLAKFQGIPVMRSALVEKMSLFSPDGKRAITNGLDFETSYLYDSTSGKEIVQLEGIFVGTSPDGQRIITSNIISVLETGTTNLYDSLGQKISTLNGAFAGVSPNSHNLVTYSYKLKEITELPISVTFHIFDISGQELATVPGVYDPLHQEGEKSPTFSSDGKRMVTFTNKGQVFLFDLSGKEIAKFDGIFEGFSKDGKQLLIRSEDTFQLFDAFGKKIFQTEGVYSQFSPDAQRLLIVSRQ